MRKFLIAALSFFLILLIGGGIYTYMLLDQVQKEISFSDSDSDTPDYEPVTPEDLGISDTAPKEEDTSVVNILLFGLDSRSEGQQSRSDTIMIATVDKKNKELKLTSLMRDMYVPIPGKQDNRINAAYALGGPGLAIKTVNTNFNLSIDRYVTVDFFGLEKIIDKVGGISIDVKSYEVNALNSVINELNNLNKNTSPVSRISNAGEQTLNGRQAVAYARIRKVGNSDYERTERQRTVLNQLFKKAKSVSLLKLPDLATSMLPYVETNLTKTEMLNLGMSVMGFESKEIQQYRLPVDGAFRSQRIRGMAVLVPDIVQNANLLHEFIYEKE